MECGSRPVTPERHGTWTAPAEARRSMAPEKMSWPLVERTSPVTAAGRLKEERCCSMAATVVTRN
jgi:hypothetical protein